MPPLLLDDEEAVAVAIGLRTAAEGTIAGIGETALRALAKLEQVLPSRLRRRVNALQTYTVPVPADRPGPSVGSDTLMTLTAACRDHETLRFDYRDHAGSSTLRIVEPFRLVSWGRRRNRRRTPQSRGGHCGSGRRAHLRPRDRGRLRRDAVCLLRNAGGRFHCR
jgi:predicted DNA-binding transcriptional regulator YafY